jgi:hypothetical protein
MSLYHLGMLKEEEYQRCILVIGGIDIFMPHSLVESNTCNECEEVMYQASKEEVTGPNVLKYNSLCTVGAVEEKQ